MKSPFSYLEDIFDKKAALLAHMGNESRLRLFIILREGEDTVNSLAKKTGLTQSALSQHLAKLRKSKLVTTRRDAQKIYYSCASPAVLRMLDVLDDIYREPVEGSKAS